MAMDVNRDSSNLIPVLQKVLDIEDEPVSNLFLLKQCFYFL